MDVVKAQDSFKKTMDAQSHIYNSAKDDLRFLSDDEFSQWDDKAKKERIAAGKPIVQIDLLNQYVHQVANDIRMNTPSINPIPATDGDKETAEILKGLIRDIEYKSSADNAYDMAANYAVKCGIGWIRIDHDYENDRTLNQVLQIKRVINPMSVYLDCGSVEPDGSDAKEGWVIDKLSVAEFKEKYAGKSPVSFGDVDSGAQEETVQICEYFKVVESEKLFAFLDGGVYEYSKEMGDVPRRMIRERTVKRYVMSGADILEEGTFPGKYIPLVPVYGEEDFVDGKRRVYSLIRKSKQAQRLFNYWKSLETELLQKQPKARYMAAAGQVEDYEEDYRNADKASVLRYTPVDLNGQPVPPPQPIAPPMPPTGVIQASQMAASEIQATLGIYGAGVGDRTNEVSGVAIDSRKLESDVATYHFGDNLIKSICHVGRILLGAISVVYDTARVVRTIGREDQPEEVGINGQMVEGQERTYDLTQGEYDVRVITGAPFTTRRQEAARFVENVLTRSPQLMPIVGDLMFKNSDIEGAQEISERLKKTMDPKLFDENAEDPQLAALMQQIEQMQGQMQAMGAELQEKRTQQQIDREKNQIELTKAQLDAQIKIKELQIKQDELNAERERLAVENMALQMSQPANIAANATI